jgi:hypothetical protein
MKKTLCILAAGALTCGVAGAAATNGNQPSADDSSWRLCHPHGPTFREFQALSSDDPVWQLPNEAGTIPLAIPCTTNRPMSAYAEKLDKRATGHTLPPIPDRSPS